MTEPRSAPISASRAASSVALSIKLRSLAASSDAFALRSCSWIFHHSSCSDSLAGSGALSPCVMSNRIGVAGGCDGGVLGVGAGLTDVAGVPCSSVLRDLVATGVGGVGIFLCLDTGTPSGFGGDAFEGATGPFRTGFCKIATVSKTWAFSLTVPWDGSALDVASHDGPAGTSIERALTLGTSLAWSGSFAFKLRACEAASAVRSLREVLDLVESPLLCSVASVLALATHSRSSITLRCSNLWMSLASPEEESSFRWVVLLVAGVTGSSLPARGAPVSTGSLTQAAIASLCPVFQLETRFGPSPSVSYPPGESEFSVSPPHVRPVGDK